MAEGAEGAEACVRKTPGLREREQLDRGDTKMQTDVCSGDSTDIGYPARHPAQIKARASGCWIQTCSSSRPVTSLPADGSPSRPARLHTERPGPADLLAERGSSSWPCRTRGKLILFTFNLLFPPLWNLERAKSCNTCIKNKCSRNGPTGSVQQRGFCGLAKRACGEKQSIRPIFLCVLSNNNNPHLDLHRKSSTCSRENKGAYFLCPCQLVQGGEYDEM